MDILHISRPRHIGDLVALEYDQNYCRDTVTLAAAAAALVLSRTVVGQQGIGAGAAVAGGSNTGNGTFGAITLGANAHVGAYLAACTQATTGTPAAAVVPHEGNVGTGVLGTVTVTAPAILGANRVELTATGATAAFDVFNPQGVLIGSGNVATLFTGGGLSFTLANAGTMTKGDSWDIIVTDNGVAVFSLTDPKGVAQAPITVGTAYVGQLDFTLSNGATKFVVGDSFTVTVAAGSGKWLPVSATAEDGTQNAAGVVVLDADATNGDTPMQILSRGPAIIRSAELIWPTGATTNQIAAWVAQLAALSPPIKVVTSG